MPSPRPPPWVGERWWSPQNALPHRLPCQIWSFYIKQYDQILQGSLWGRAFWGDHQRSPTHGGGRGLRASKILGTFPIYAYRLTQIDHIRQILRSDHTRWDVGLTLLQSPPHPWTQGARPPGPKFSWHYIRTHHFLSESLMLHDVLLLLFLK